MFLLPDCLCPDVIVCTATCILGVELRTVRHAEHIHQLSDTPAPQMHFPRPRVRTEAENWHLSLACVLFMDNPLGLQLVLSFVGGNRFPPF